MPFIVAEHLFDQIRVDLQFGVILVGHGGNVCAVRRETAVVGYIDRAGIVHAVMVHGNQFAVHVITDSGAIIFDGPNMPIMRQPRGTVADTVFQTVNEYAGAPFLTRCAVIAADAGCGEGIIRHGGEPFQNQQRTVRRTAAAGGFAGADAVFVFMLVQPERGTHAVQPVPIHFGADFGAERAACIYHTDGFQPATGILGHFPCLAHT